MGPQEFIWKYLAGPVIADAKNAETAVWQGVTAHTGYNPVNTVTWAVLAAVLGYGVIRGMKRYDVEFNTRTVVHSVPFILLGGVLRFLEDTGELPFVIRPFLITPVIYFVIAVLYLGSFGLALRYTSKEEERNRMLLKTGSAVLTVPVIAALYMLSVLGVDPVLAISGLAVSGAITGLYYVLVRDTGYDRTGFHLAAFSQFFGGAVSMIGVTQGYTQKQLLAQFSTQLLGPPGILIVKSAVLAAALYIATDSDRVTKALLVLALTVVGLATGLRVYLRMIAGI